MSDYARANEFKRLFQNYLHYSGNQGESVRLPVGASALGFSYPPLPLPLAPHQPQPSSSDDPTTTAISEKKTNSNIVLSHLPDIYKSKGWLLLPGSNAVDLVKEALIAHRSKKGHSWEPTGWNEFLNTLRDSNVPNSLFGKKKTLYQLHQQQGYPSFYQPHLKDAPVLSEISNLKPTSLI